MTNVRRSLLIWFAQSNSQLVIQFASSLFIARLLTPHEIGIFSIGCVIVSFSHIIRDMGVSNYVVQERELTKERIRSAQAIVWITSWSIALLLLLLAAWAGDFYAEAGVTLTIQILAVNFILLPIGIVTIALLKREMAFGQLSIINICSSLTNALTGVCLAWHGFGFISLAWASVAGVIASAVGAFFFRPRHQPWLPGFSEWRRVFSAGTKLSAASMFSEIGLGGPELVTGRLLGFEAVAYFSRGFGAAMMAFRALADSLMPVAIAFFAQQLRSDNDLKTPYLRGVEYMSVLSFPAFAGLGVLAEPVILFLYGDQWLEATMPLQIVCSGLACWAIATVASSVLVGTGKIGTNLRMLAVFQPAKVVLVILGGNAFGLAGVAAGVAIGDIVISARCFFLTNQIVGVSLREFVRCTFSSLCIATATALAAWGVLCLIASVEALILRVGLPVLGGGTVWLVGLVLTKHPFLTEIKKVCRWQH